MILNPAAKPSTLTRGRVPPRAQAQTARPNRMMASLENQTSLETAAPAATPRWAWAVGTVFGVGHLRPGPGTWGSLTAALLWWAIGLRIPPDARLWVLAAATALVTVIGIRAATLVARGA